MAAFHNKLIEENGYNSQNYDVQFFVMDREDEDEINEQSDVSGDRLTCGTIYRTSNGSAGLVQVNCRARRT